MPRAHFAISIILIHLESGNFLVGWSVDCNVVCVAVAAAGYKMAPCGIGWRSM